MKCKLWQENVSLNNAADHPCFIGKVIFMDDENNLFMEYEDKPAVLDKSATLEVENSLSTEHLNKQPAVWDRSATLALLSLYEMKMDMLDHPKKMNVKYKGHQLKENVHCMELDLI
ncbi:hypothetical protein DMN91_000487 [Ooceraea biroi]|uniref:Uncharacterized protein n=1 Tax=Ooceraea biroi TaxID=2015173 RepID=A0A3L8E1T6_OOCBI|nr:hypothetical protein DMN91_000487 [Ooceraea biroi]